MATPPTSPTRSVAAKMGLRPGARVHLVGDPPGVADGLGMPEVDVADALDGTFDHLHLFVTREADLGAGLVRLRPHLAPRGALWVSWPKARGLGTDLTLPDVIRVSYDHGLVESTCLSVDATWSGLRLTRPVAGRTYANSYGRLPGR